MSFWKDDLLKINGYNETFLGWGSEDFDIAVRLFNAGVKQYFLYLYAISYHLYHAENDRRNSELNRTLFSQSLAQKTIRIEQGIDKHFHEI
jgi:predicted glycosyltransferase involved in capsule biosynthesis